jgi:hypothetical protein
LKNRCPYHQFTISRPLPLVKCILMIVVSGWTRLRTEDPYAALRSWRRWLPMPTGAHQCGSIAYKSSPRCRCPLMASPPVSHDLIPRERCSEDKPSKFISSPLPLERGWWGQVTMVWSSIPIRTARSPPHSQHNKTQQTAFGGSDAIRVAAVNE